MNDDDTVGGRVEGGAPENTSNNSGPNKGSMSVAKSGKAHAKPAAKSGSKAKGKRKAGKKGRSSKPVVVDRPLTTNQRAVRALREIESLARAICKDLGVAGRDELPLEEIILPLSVRLDPHGGTQEAAERLMDGLAGRIYEAVKGAVAFRPGHVYCFACDEPACACSKPGDLRETFAGYTATGRPVWRGFGNLCLDLKHPKVDKLYGAEAEVVVLGLTGDELTGELLDGFGRDSRTYKVLAQIVAGFLPANLKPSSDEEGERRVLTLQLVETSSGQRAKRIRLNVIGLERDALVELADRDPAGPAEAVRQILGATRQRLGGLSRTLAERELRDPLTADAAELVTPIAVRMRSDLARALKPIRHRTDHAKNRHRDGDRPTASAINDARKAADTALFRDMRRETVVVIGPRGRAHVFNDGGQHVTSLSLSPGELDKKTSQGRWQPLAPFQVVVFREALGR